MEFNKVPQEPKFTDALKELKKDIFLTLNCHAIGFVQSFDTTNQTIKATIAYKKTFYELEPDGETFKKVLRDYPVLIDCPAIVMGGGNVSLKMPIKEGDECLVIFNDRSIDRWFEGGQSVELESSRLHSFSDAIVLVGLNSLKNSLEGYEDDKAVLGDETASLKVGNGDASINASDTIVKVAEKVQIENSAENLNTVLQEILTAIQAITVSGVTPGGGVSGAPANAAAFATLATRLGSLLE
jgi:hypothetical protein